MFMSTPTCHQRAAAKLAYEARQLRRANKLRELHNTMYVEYNDFIFITESRIHAVLVGHIELLDPNCAFNIIRRDRHGGICARPIINKKWSVIEVAFRVKSCD